MAKVLQIVKLNGKVYAPANVVDPKTGEVIKYTPTHPEIPDAPDTIPDGELSEKDVRELVASGAIEDPSPKYKLRKALTAQQQADENQKAIEKAKAENATPPPAK